MSYENSAGLGVNNHYGARNPATTTAGAGGNDTYRTASYTVEDGLVIAGVVPANSIVTKYHTFDVVGAVGAVSVGATQVAADGTVAGDVNTAASGQISIAGTLTSGKLLVEFFTVGDSV